MKKLVMFFIGLLMLSFPSFSQTYTYSSTPAIETYVSCPSACNDWLGSVVQMKLKSINESSFTFTIKKCDGSAWTSSGNFYIGWDTDMQCSGNPPSNYESVVAITAGMYSKDITVPASWFGGGNNSYWVGAYSNGTNTYYAGMVTVTRTLAVPATPTGLSASAVSTSSISLSWNSVSGATSYDVYDCGGSYVANTSNTSYSVSGLSAGTYYAYKVRAKNTGGNSSFTSCAGATTNSNTLSINPSGSQNVSSTAGNGSISVSSNITWTATSDQSWLTITAGSSGSGNGTVSYSYSANSGTSTRSASITLSASGVSSQTLTVVQAGASLYLSISPTTTQNVNSSSGTGNISVSSNVTWTATSDQSWLTITAGSSGSGNGTVSYSYSANSGTSTRSASITLSASGVSSQTLTVVQAGASLYLSISPTATQNVNSSSGTGNISVSSNVTWTATSDQSWLTITAGSSGSGNGTVSYSYSANSSTSSRSASITLSASGVPSQTLTVVQAGVPMYLVISPNGTFNLNENSGVGSIGVSSNTSWEAVSDQSWLTISSGSTGNGNATINYAYTANVTSEIRTATITVSATGLSSQTLTLIQQEESQTQLCVVPKAILPQDMSTDIATQTHFVWERVSGTNVSYNIEVYTASDVLVYSNDGITSTDYRLIPEEALDRGSVNYKYRIQASIDGQVTPWSDLRSFNTLMLNNSNLWSIGVPLGHYKNVIAYSNSGYPSSDYSCNSGDDCSYVSGINTGLKWQCTEYVLRYYWQSYRLNLHSNGMNGNANSFDNNALLAGLRFISCSSNQLPMPGDILIWDDGYGHVAIVMSVNYDEEGNYSLTVAQQNVSAGQFVNFEMQVEQDNFSHNVIYGSKHYAGFITPRPVFASTNPQDGGVISTTTPTIAWEYLPQGSFTIYIKEMDETGCYQTYHNYTGYGQSFYVNQDIALTPGKNYLYRVVNNLPSGQYQNPVVYFSVAETKSSATEEILPEKLTVRVVDENNAPVSDVSIYSETENGIVYRGISGSAGVCNMSTFYEVDLGDKIVCKSPAYLDVEKTIVAVELESGLITIVLDRNETNNSIFGGRIIALQHGTENQNQIFTEPDLELVITAEMHNGYSLCIPDYYIENIENCSDHFSTDSVISLSLFPGANLVRVMFYNSQDTVTIEKTLFYYPESYMEEYSQQVTVISTSTLAETMLLVDGNFVGNLSGDTDVFDLTNGVHDLVFLKDGFYEYVRVYADTTIVLDYNPSTANHFEEQKIELYPNPADDKVTILNADGIYAELFDAVGRKIGQYYINSEKFMIDLSAFETGVYVLRYTDGKAGSFTRLVKL